MPVEKKDILAKIDGILKGFSAIPKKNLEHQAPANLGEDVNGIIDLAIAIDPSKQVLFPKKFTFSARLGRGPSRTMASYQEIQIFLEQVRKIVEQI